MITTDLRCLLRRWSERYAGWSHGMTPAARAGSFRSRRNCVVAFWVSTLVRCSRAFALRRPRHKQAFDSHQVHARQTPASSLAEDAIAPAAQ